MRQAWVHQVCCDKGLNWGKPFVREKFFYFHAHDKLLFPGSSAILQGRRFDMFSDSHLEIFDQKHWGCDDHAIINMDQKNYKGSPLFSIEHCLIDFALQETEQFHDFDEDLVPASSGLLKSIQGLQQVAYFGLQASSCVSRWLFHENNLLGGEFAI